MASVLMISGSVRLGSVNSAVIATAAELLPVGVTPIIYSGLADLPHFNPDLDQEPLPDDVAQLRRMIEESSAIFFSSPEYAGAIPGALKNLLEWTVGGTEIASKPTGWVNPSTMPTRAAATYASLRIVLGYTDADVIEQACADVPVPRSMIGENGIVRDEAIRSVPRASPPSQAAMPSTGPRAQEFPLADPPAGVRRPTVTAANSWSTNIRG